MPTAIEQLRRRREAQADERDVAPVWETHTYEGVPVDLVFTTPNGGLVLRQTISKIVKQAAATAGITESLATHTGRRTVVTTLFVDGGEALEDIAGFVGHSRPSTTAGYVKRRGRRPEAVAKRAAALLDGQEEPASEVRNHLDGFGSNRGSNDPGEAGTDLNEKER